MTLFDLAILLTVFFFAFQGFRNGLIREVLTLVALVLALIAALQFMDSFALWIRQFADLGEESALILSATLIFSAVFITALVLAHLAQRVLELIRLNLINRLLGLIFGAFKSVLLLSLVLVVLAGMDIPSEETRRDSIIYSYILQLAPILFEQLETRVPAGPVELFSNLLSLSLNVVTTLTG